MRSIVEFFYHNSNNFNIKNVDLVDEALSLQERKQRYHSQQYLEQREQSKLVNEIINNLRKNKISLGGRVEEYVSSTEKEIKEIMNKFRIKINRQEMKDENNKGVNKCKDNKKAFFEYKLGKLFLRNKELDPYEQDQERKRLVQKVTRKLKKDLLEL